MQFKDFVHIVNPNQEKRRAVSNFFQQNPKLNSVFVERTSHPTHLETVAEWAVNEGHRCVAVWGGDGTLNRVTQKFYEMNALGKMTLALVPVGTCNDFARALKIPTWKKVAALALAGAGSEWPVDVGLLSYTTSRGVRRRVFVNNAGFGRNASALGPRRSNPIRDIFSFTSKRMDLDWMLGKSHSFETRELLLGVVCNGPYFSKGLHFDANVSVDDGVLDAYLEGPRSALGLLWSFLKARLGGALASGATFHVAANEVSVQSPQLLFPQADGEPVDPFGVTRMVFSCLPKALRLVRWG